MNKPINSLLILSTVLMFASSCVTSMDTKPALEVKGGYLCISLKNYFNEVDQSLQSGKQVSKELDSLFGLSWLDGYVIDFENNDIVLVGKTIASRPAYHTEDLFVNFQNVYDSASAPYCSLDPIAEDILRFRKCFENQSNDFAVTIDACREAIGGQQVIIGGVPRNSRHAKIMIFADYDMKKISQGLIKDSGIRSCIDFSMMDTVAEKDQASPGSSMSRFWFHIKEKEGGKFYPNYVENEGIVFINECPVVVLTEKQVADEAGNLTDNAEEVDQPAELFAAEFTGKFSEIAAKSEIFAELENLFRLQACFRAMKMKDAVAKSGVDLTGISEFSLKQGENDLPATLPGLVNYRINEKTTENQEGTYTSKRLYLVAGGVSQEMTVSESNMIYQESIKKPASIVVKARPKKNSVYWFANITDSKIL